MAYTVKKLAKISGVSIRTLHWYDKLDLLKPSFYGANGYRYYEEEQLLLLQQILFFRELGFPLKDILELLKQNNFDKVKALHTHKSILKEDIHRKKQLIKTIDKTILHLRGNEMMTDKELYYGFDSTKQKEYEQYIVQYHGSTAEKLLLESKKRTAKWDKHEWDDVKNQGDILHKELAKAIDNGLKPDSEEVQKIIHRHFQLQNRFFDMTKDVYIGLTHLYAEHPDFKKFFEAYHLKMIEFIGEAIRIYANKNL